MAESKALTTRAQDFSAWYNELITRAAAETDPARRKQLQEQAEAMLVADAPVALTTQLGRLLKPGDRIFNLQRWGSWFELSLPDNPVFVDSRIRVASARVIESPDVLIASDHRPLLVDLELG